jgi:hypothetical protein
MSTRNEMLTAAARCFLRAGDQDEAGECYELVGAWAEAASLHDNAGRGAQAAVMYQRAGRWLDAARCHRASGRPETEAYCLEAGGDPLGAAWVLAHDVGNPQKAELLLSNTELASLVDKLAGELVHARVEAALGDTRASAKRLSATFARIRGFQGPIRERLSAWALAVTEALRRPDLGAVVLVTVMESTSGSERTWDAWAQRVFGEPVPPPVPLGADPSRGEERPKA